MVIKNAKLLWLATEKAILPKKRRLDYLNA